MPLKILVVMEENSWVNIHIANSLEAMGHNVSRFYFGDSVCEFYGYTRRHEHIEKNKKLVSFAKSLRDKQGLDLIFCYVYDDFLMPKYAKALSDLKVFMVNYNVDMAIQWFRQIRTACYFDIMLCAQPDNMDNLRKYSKKVYYFPMAAQSVTSLSSNVEKIHDVTFLGTALPYRRYALSQLAKSSVPLSIYGKYWDSTQPNVYIRNIPRLLNDMRYYAWPRFRAEGLAYLWQIFLKRLRSDKSKVIDNHIPMTMIKGSVSNGDLLTIFQRSKINIGLTRYAIDDPNKVGHCQMRLRDFEVPMTGGFYLVEKSSGYDQAFIDGKEVVTWQTIPELVEKINYYLKHDDEREAIAAAGQKRAMQDHTWAARFNTLFLELGLNA